MIIGVLAIQGAFLKHQEVLRKLGIQSTLVKHPADLSGINGLIIPGGESTTMTKILRSEKWSDDAEQFARTHPVFGTCAGAIMLSSSESHKVNPWHIIDMEISRNAFGRQIHSFITEIETENGMRQEKFPAVFIRAPRITSIGDQVQVLGRYKGEPVLVRQGSALAATFHPELTDATDIHQYFIEEICSRAKAA